MPNDKDLKNEASGGKKSVNFFQDLVDVLSKSREESQSRKHEYQPSYNANKNLALQFAKLMQKEIANINMPHKDLALQFAKLMQKEIANINMPHKDGEALQGEGGFIFKQGVYYEGDLFSSLCKACKAIPGLTSEEDQEYHILYCMHENNLCSFISRDGESITIKYEFLTGLSLAYSKYWSVDIGGDASLKVKSGDFTPSEALHALVDYISILDCGKTLTLAKLLALEKLIGTENFNLYFNAEERKLKISEEPVIDFLYEVQKSIDINDVGIGSIIWLEGVEGYLKKHPHGSGRSFYLLCVGKNESEDDVFLGFDLNFFDRPRTLKEIEEMLIKKYNKEPSELQNFIMKITGKKQEVFPQYTGDIEGIKAAATLDENSLLEILEKYKLLKQSTFLNSDASGGRVDCRPPGRLPTT